MSDSTPAAATDRQVLITRVFDAPRERIRIDLRVGGRYELTMVRRDGGGELAIGYDIVELVEPELIVLRSDPMPEMGAPRSTSLRPSSPAS
jgi:uncharacterized protein YndB with AHSA1/START domain